MRTSCRNSPADPKNWSEENESSRSSERLRILSGQLSSTTLTSWNKGRISLPRLPLQLSPPFPPLCRRHPISGSSRSNNNNSSNSRSSSRQLPRCLSTKISCPESIVHPTLPSPPPFTPLGRGPNRSPHLRGKTQLKS